MKYFIDTEFIDGLKKPISWLPTIGNFNKPIWTIQLVSLGVKSDDGRELYLVSRDFNPSDASEWVVENVLSKLPNEWIRPFGEDHVVRNHKYRTNKEIAEALINFVSRKESGSNSVEFWGYYSDYDWVVLCSNLFGSMMDLPKNFPMYCKDLKQELDWCAHESTFSEDYGDGKRKYKGFQLGLDKALDLLKTSPGYPVETNCHDALDDARWNRELYYFIERIKQSV